MKYFKRFNQHTDYETFKQTDNFLKPNLSYCKDEDKCHFNPWYDPERFVAKFNVTSTTTGTSIFNNPTLLSKLEIDGVEYTGNDIFSHMNHTFSTTGIHTVKYTLTDGTTTIDGATFSGKPNMISITIPDTITGIFAAAFAGCTSLRSISIPNSVTTIGSYSSGTIGNTFFYCKLKSINISSSVIILSEGVFAGTNFNFEDVIFESINPNATFVVDTINKCITNIDGTVLLAGFNNTIAIPDSVTTIGQNAFYGCSGLTNIIIPNSVTTIGQYAFDSCSGITDLTIGNSVTSIGNSAFNSCSSITTITSLATTAPTIQSKTFESVNPNGTLYVPSGSTGYDVWMGTGDSYLGKYNWTKVDNIPY